MPNWCENTLTVTGPKEHLDIFKKLSIVDGEFKMNGVFPTPEELLNTVSPNTYKGDREDEKAIKEHKEYVNGLLRKYGHSDWYSWRVANWGTKWDASDMQGISIDEDEELTVWFATAWSPPIEWVKSAFAKFQSLNFSMTFLEEALDICGRFSIIDGFENEEDVEVEYVDEDGLPVEKDGDKWVYSDTREIAGDEDFWPTAVNPFE